MRSLIQPLASKSGGNDDRPTLARAAQRAIFLYSNICPHLRSGSLVRFRIESGPNSPNPIGSQLGQLLQIHSLLLSIFVKFSLIAGPRQVGLDSDTKDKDESIVDAHRSERIS